MNDRAAQSTSPAVVPLPQAAPSADLHARIAAAQADPRLIGAVHRATLHKVAQRAAGMAELRDPEALRSLAAQIKQHTLANLPDLLGQFVANFEAQGGTVHFARDAAAAREIVTRIAREHGCRRAVKSKSMATEEVHLNDALIAAGVETWETDLGEFIVQLDRDRPSHIVTPIIHKTRQQVAAAMQRELGCEKTDDPRALSEIARRFLREKFRTCDLGISGVNFAIAENGTLCICTNEGNGRMTTSRPRVHIALMGIEKVIPRMVDLGVFLKLLARSSTGQPLTVYTNLIRGPRRADEPDGPEHLHLVLLDNGRSEILRGPLAEVLRCIRCGACLNACPVYRNIGGHAYGGVYGGPIGSLLTPLFDGLMQQHELPRASSLCGACAAACPVKIDIPGLLVKLRSATRAKQPLTKRLALRAWRWANGAAWRYALAQRLLRWFLRGGRDGWVRSGPGPLGAWTSVRDLPRPAARSFRQRWNEELRS